MRKCLQRLDISRAAFWLACVIGIFGYGVLVGRYQLFPYAVLSAGSHALRQVHADRETILRIRPSDLLQHARYEGDGVTRLDAAAAAPGYTLITSFFGSGHEVRLISLDGTVIQRWPVQYFVLFPRPEHVPADQLPQSEWNLATHGAVILPDGSVVLTFNFFGTVKLDRCGTAQWTLPRTSHHSVERAADGGYWLPGRRSWSDTTPFPVLRPPFDEDTILKVSADGTAVAELSVLDILFKNRLEALLFANGLGGTELASPDILHLNDIEELDAAVAAAFPSFRAGDLLLSLRNLNLLMVVDPQTLEVKWHQIGPWIAQHDPDFQPTGRVSLFNNNNDRTETGSILGGSTIMEVDPRTGITHTRYGGTEEQRMFSDIRGDHQYLPNGNVLITESQAGRVFEADAQGRVVWEFINRHSSDRVAIITAASRHPEEYFTVSDWSCR